MFQVNFSLILLISLLLWISQVSTRTEYEPELLIQIYEDDTGEVTIPDYVINDLQDINDLVESVYKSHMEKNLPNEIFKAELERFDEMKKWAINGSFRNSNRSFNPFGEQWLVDQINSNMLTLLGKIKDEKVLQNILEKYPRPANIDRSVILTLYDETTKGTKWADLQKLMKSRGWEDIADFYKIVDNKLFNSEPLFDNDLKEKQWEDHRNNYNTEISQRTEANIKERGAKIPNYFIYDRSVPERHRV